MSCSDEHQNLDKNQKSCHHRMSAGRVRRWARMVGVVVGKLASVGCKLEFTVFDIQCLMVNNGCGWKWLAVVEFVGGKFVSV